MKRLYIIRHAKSSWEQEDIDDMVRPLIDNGKSASLLLGNWLMHHKIKPDEVITSPATRALHTAINICSWIDFPISKMDIDQKIYFGNIKSITDKLIQLDQSAKEINSVFLIGHEPLMSEMVYKFTKDVLDKFPTSALYSISWNVDSWADAMHLLGSKVDFITPKSLLKSK